jgi:hypothetical protein
MTSTHSLSKFGDSSGNRDASGDAAIPFIFIGLLILSFIFFTIYKIVHRIFPKLNAITIIILSCIILNIYIKIMSFLNPPITSHV